MYTRKAPWQARLSARHARRLYGIRARVLPLARPSRVILLGLDDLAVLVETAARAHAMRELGLAALRANGARRCGNAVVGAATCISAGAAHLTLRYCHDLSPSYYTSERASLATRFDKRTKRYITKPISLTQVLRWDFSQTSSPSMRRKDWFRPHHPRLPHYKSIPPRSS